MTLIRAISPADEAAWRGMWADYCAFYGESVDEAVTAGLWARLLDPAAQTKALIAETDGAAIGFANYVLHPYTWGLNPVCYLEDLFVAPAARGRNVGHDLIAALVDMARAQGWDRIYWHTRADNIRARRLYDRFSPADDFVRYRIAID